jgi:transcriptional regulator with XRE-family HTH domain
MDSKLVGSFIRKRRLSLKLTQRQVAEMLGFQTCQFISNIERGIADIPPFRIKDFANVLQVDPTELATMVSDSMRTRLLKKTAINVTKDGTALGRESDPFLEAFTVAWQTASPNTKQCMKYVAKKLLNMDYELECDDEEISRRVGRPSLNTVSTL